MKKWISPILLLLAVSILVLTAASCSKKRPGSPTVTSESLEAETDYLNTLDPNLYVNQTFRVMTIEGMYVDLKPGGDVVEAALYHRDDKMQTYFNVDIEYGHFENNDTKAINTLTNIVMSGVEQYNAFVTSAKRLTRLAMQSLLSNLRSVDHLALDNPWWSQTFNENCTFDNSAFHNVQFVAAGPFSELFYHSALCLAYNNVYTERYDLPDIVSLVRSGDWTLEQMYEICTDYDVVKDNGDGTMNEQDQYAVAVTAPFLYGTYASCGGNFSTFDENGDICVELANEHSISILSDLIKLYQPSVCYMEGIHLDAEKMFLEGRSLFMYNSTGYMIETLPSSTLDYTIVPCPKYNTDQKSYVTCAWPDSNYCVAVPVGLSQEELGFSGLMLEAYCYLSDVYVKPAKYGTMVSLRLALNQETQEMLDLIFDTLYFDMNLIFDFGGTKTTLNERLAASNLGRFTTLMKNAENVVKKEINDLISNNNAQSQ